MAEFHFGPAECTCFQVAPCSYCTEIAGRCSTCALAEACSEFVPDDERDESCEDWEFEAAPGKTPCGACEGIEALLRKGRAVLECDGRGGFNSGALSPSDVGMVHDPFRKFPASDWKTYFVEADPEKWLHRNECEVRWGGEGPPVHIILSDKVWYKAPTLARAIIGIRGEQERSTATEEPLTPSTFREVWFNEDYDPEWETWEPPEIMNRNCPVELYHESPADRKCRQIQARMREERRKREPEALTPGDKQAFKPVQAGHVWSVAQLMLRADELGYAIVKYPEPTPEEKRREAMRKFWRES